MGKTELAKALATYLSNLENAMVPVDRIEYGENSSITRLVGAAPGLVGYGDRGQLTTPVRRQPYSVVLFDEIEKAHEVQGDRICEREVSPEFINRIVEFIICLSSPQTLSNSVKSLKSRY